FKEEISDGDWVYFFKDKHGKYYYNNRNVVSEKGYGVKTVWYRCVVGGKANLEEKVSIHCETRSIYINWHSGGYNGERSIKPESLLDYLQAKVCKE
ncbi:MAG TPA: hypothetical protein PLI61_06180, partial [bacterium]|nr:hypothetical protein [bacterium]